MAAGTLAVAVAACENTPVELPEATNIVVPVTALTLIAGDEAGLTAQVLDQDGRLIPDARVSWMSSAPSVVAVFDDDGAAFVEAFSVGTATLTATYGSLTATVEVTVTPDTRDMVQSVEFMEESGTYDVVEGSVLLPFQAYDGFGELDCFGVDDGLFSLTSSDESVAEIDGLDGCQVEVTLNGPGTTTITMSSNGASDTYELTVTAVVDNADFVGVIPGIAVAGQIVPVSVKAIDETGAPIVGQTIHFDVEIGTLDAVSVQTGADGIATVEWTVPTDLRDIGVQSSYVAFSAELPSGRLEGDLRSVTVTPDAATSLKLFHLREEGYVEITEDTLTFATATSERILVASYDQYGNLVETDNAMFATTPDDVVTGTGDTAFFDGKLVSISPYADVSSTTEEAVTLTVEVTTAESEVLETDLAIKFVAPTPI
ncbi:MAG TPA: Ig-like domain-containing protein [Longimicrobiales bacterium]